MMGIGTMEESTAPVPEKSFTRMSPPELARSVTRAFNHWSCSRWLMWA